MRPKRLETIEYTPYSIKELLAKMKDLSMLMVDLSYASLLFRNKELADEVLELEGEIDTLLYHLQINTMLAARDAEDAESLQSILRIARLTDRISNCAGDLAGAVVKGQELHHIVIEGLKRMEEPIATVKISDNSPLARKSIRGSMIRTKHGVQIIAIRRSGDWIIHPKKIEKIYPEDVLIARGSKTGIDSLKRVVGVAEGTISKED